MNARSARRTVAGVHIAAGAFVIVIVGLLWICAALLEPTFEGSFVPGLVAMFGRPVAALLIGLGVLEIAAALALLRRKAWARVALLALSVLQLLIFPIGTAIAVLSGWLLMTACRAVDEPVDLSIAAPKNQ